MKTFQAEDTLAEQIPVKTLKMANIENDAMAFGNWALIERIESNDGKERIGTVAGIQYAIKQILRNRNGGLGGKHVKSPKWCLLTDAANWTTVRGLRTETDREDKIL